MLQRGSGSLLDEIRTYTDSLSWRSLRLEGWIRLVMSLTVPSGQVPQHANHHILKKEVVQIN